MPDDTPKPPTTWRDYLPAADKVRMVILWLLTSLLMAVAARYGFPPPPVLVEVEKRVEVPVVVGLDGQPPVAHGTGWVADPDEVSAVVGRVNPPVFAATPAGQVGDIPAAVYLWKAYEKLPVRAPPVKDQGEIGSCVS